MHDTIKEQLERDGYVVLDDFLRPEECDELLQAAREFTENLPDKEDRAVFSASQTDTQVSRHNYFIESNDKIRPFFEEDALDSQGNLVVDASVSLNKVGHALHCLHPVFRCYTYCDRVKAVCRALELREPAVVQSMLIYKNPSVGGEVMAHQDATYLYSEPVPPVGFWLALADATTQNGCLWVARGSHRSGVHRRLQRAEPGAVATAFDRPAPLYPASGFTPVPVKKGACVLLHGLVVHRSGRNAAAHGRPAYTFHVVERHRNTYSPLNWLQEGGAAPFCDLYSARQLD